MAAAAWTCGWSSRCDTLRRLLPGASMRTFLHALIVVTATACAGAPPASRAPAPVPAADKPLPAAVAAINPLVYAQLDSIMATAIHDSITPGGVIVVARHGKLVLLRPYGTTWFDSTAHAVTDSTIYDMASLTKVVATTTAAMILEEDSLLDIDRTVASYLPEFNAPDKAAMTVRMLLLHRSGMHQSGLGSSHGLQQYIDSINKLPLKWAPGTHTEYSDWSMVVMQAVVERIAGKTLDQFTRERVFEPLGMHDTGFNPGDALKQRAAPTTARRAVVQGSVMDPIAFALDGVSGNAGLFSSGRDLAVFVQMLLNGGEHNGARILHPATIARWTARQNADASRALGWDTPADSASSGRFMSPWSFGHTGFTGTSIWADPNADMFVVLLTNYTHASSNNPRIRALRWAVDEAVRSAVMDMPVRQWREH
jgi:CubicO group peptidase (beta-lactamase class C family)